MPRVQNTATCAGKRCELSLTPRQKGGGRGKEKILGGPKFSFPSFQAARGGFVRDGPPAAGQVRISEAFCECWCQAVKATYPSLTTGIF